jgi:hypothetical protein
MDLKNSSLLKNIVLAIAAYFVFFAISELLWIFIGNSQWSLQSGILISAILIIILVPLEILLRKSLKGMNMPLALACVLGAIAPTDLQQNFLDSSQKFSVAVLFTALSITIVAFSAYLDFKKNRLKNSGSALKRNK